MRIDIRIQNDDFDFGSEYELLRQREGTIGAIVCFSGLVREFETTDDTKPLRNLTLQHYPGMTEKLLAEIVDQACQRWPLSGVTVIHRVGELKPAEQIVFVGIASAHRSEAFLAAEYVMDYLKTRATIWKSVSDGHQTQWVGSKQSDQDAAESWKKNG